MHDEQLHELIGAIYDAAVDPAGWEPALGSLRDHLGGASVLFWLRCPMPGVRGEAVSTEMDLSADGVYQSRFWECDPWRPLVPRMPGAVAHLGDDLGATRLDDTDFYRDWLRPQGLHFGLAGCVLNRAGWNSTFAAMRARRRGPFDTEDLGLVTRLLPHLRRALQLRGVFADADRGRRAGRAALERIPHAAILTDEASRVIAANALGEGLLRRGDPLRLRDGTLSAAFPRDTRRLQQRVHRATRAADRPDETGGGVLALRRSAGDRFSVLVTPLSSDAGLVGATAAVFAPGPGPVLSLHRGVLRRLYGLTPTEARVAARLVGGETPRQIAETLGVKVTTVRAHLAALFRKTGTRRQAEMVQLLMGSLATIPLETPRSER